MDQRTKAAAIEQLEQSRGLLKIILADFARYKERAAAFVAAQPEPPAEAGSLVICSRMAHLNQIKLRLDFLNFVLRNSPLRLAAEQARAQPTGQFCLCLSMR